MPLHDLICAVSGHWSSEYLAVIGLVFLIELALGIDPWHGQGRAFLWVVTVLMLIMAAVRTTFRRMR